METSAKTGFVAGEEMPANMTELDKHLLRAADELRANSKLKSSEYSVPVLSLIFLRYADHRCSQFLAPDRAEKWRAR